MHFKLHDAIVLHYVVSFYGYAINYGVLP